MQLTILRTLDTPADRDIDLLVRQIEQNQGVVELVDADSRAGVALTELYDLMQRPSVLVVDASGQLLQKWEGKLPTLEDISAYYLPS